MKQRHGLHLNVTRGLFEKIKTNLIHLPILPLGIIDARIRASLERIAARWNAHSASLKYADLPENTDYRGHDEALGGSWALSLNVLFRLVHLVSLYFAPTYSIGEITSTPVYSFSYFL